MLLKMNFSFFIAGATVVIWLDFLIVSGDKGYLVNSVEDDWVRKKDAWVTREEWKKKTCYPNPYNEDKVIRMMMKQDESKHSSEK